MKKEMMIDIRKSWEEKKSKVELGGCGLFRNFTLDGIENFNNDLNKSMEQIYKMAGIKKSTVSFDVIDKLDVRLTDIEHDLMMIKDMLLKIVTDVLSSVNNVKN